MLKRDPDGIDLEVMHWPNHRGIVAGANLTSAGWRSRKTRTSGAPITGRGGTTMRGYQTDPERREVRMLLARTPLRGAHVLEIGCGDGRLTRRIAGAVRHIVGIDPEASDVARAKRFHRARHRGRTRFEVGQGEKLRFRDRTFELVLFSWSL